MVNPVGSAESTIQASLIFPVGLVPVLSPFNWPGRVVFQQICRNIHLVQDKPVLNLAPHFRHRNRPLNRIAARRSGKSAGMECGHVIRVERLQGVAVKSSQFRFTAPFSTHPSRLGADRRRLQRLGQSRLTHARCWGNFGTMMADHNTHVGLFKIAAMLLLAGSIWGGLIWVGTTANSEDPPSSDYFLMTD